MGKLNIKEYDKIYHPPEIINWKYYAVSVPAVFLGGIYHGFHVLRLGVINTAAVGQDKAASLAADLD
jgi:hypothetical protein